MHIVLCRERHDDAEDDIATRDEAEGLFLVEISQEQEADRDLDDDDLGEGQEEAEDEVDDVLSEQS